MKSLTTIILVLISSTLYSQTFNLKIDRTEVLNDKECFVMINFFTDESPDSGMIYLFDDSIGIRVWAFQEEDELMLYSEEEVYFIKHPPLEIGETFYGWLGEPGVAQVQDTVTVNSGAGSFLCQTVVYRENEMVYWAENTGLVSFPMGDMFRLMLDSVVVKGGEGFLPLALGNQWIYEMDTSAPDKTILHGQITRLGEPAADVNIDFIYWIPDIFREHLEKQQPINKHYEFEQIDSVVVPPGFELMQNYPNPFNGVTSIVFDLAAECQVALQIADYHPQWGRDDVLLTVVDTLAEEHMMAGRYQYNWDAHKDCEDASAVQLASGIYVINLDCTIDDSTAYTFRRLLYYLELDPDVFKCPNYQHAAVTDENGYFFVQKYFPFYETILMTDAAGNELGVIRTDNYINVILSHADLEDPRIYPKTMNPGQSNIFGADLFLEANGFLLSVDSLTRQFNTECFVLNLKVLEFTYETQFVQIRDDTLYMVGYQQSGGEPVYVNRPLSPLEPTIGSHWYGYYAGPVRFDVVAQQEVTTPVGSFDSFVYEISDSATNEFQGRIYMSEGHGFIAFDRYESSFNDTLSFVLSYYSLQGGDGILPLAVGNQFYYGLGELIVSVDSEFGVEVPLSTVLHQNYPNPFNPTTSIEFYLRKSEQVSLKIYDIRGREVLTLVSDHLNAGKYHYILDGTDLASGIYYYRLKSGTFEETRKMILLR